MLAGLGVCVDVFFGHAAVAAGAGDISDVDVEFFQQTPYRRGREGFVLV